MPKPAITVHGPPLGGSRHELRIPGICGSLRAGSYNRKLLEAARALAPVGIELEPWEGLKAVPPFDEDDGPAPATAVIALREAIAAADAVLIATPQYNASLPGQLENALDWASRPYETNVLRAKPVAVIGASPSPSGAARAQGEARTVLRAIGADVLDEGLPLARASEQFDAGRRLATPEHRRQLNELLRSLAARVRHGDPLTATA
jgi:chromate reductase, NAD(P)H dehydrogenase (quinone)